MRLHPLPALLALGLSACSGGGTDAIGPTGVDVRLQVLDVELPAAATIAEIPIALPELPNGSPPVLLEFTVQIDPAIVEVSATNPLIAVQNVPTLDGDATTTGFRVLFGYGNDRTAAPLAPGTLLRLSVETSTPRVTGSTNITLTDVRAVDAAGNALAVDANPVIGRLQVR